LPPNPIAFHGRDELITKAVRLLTSSSTARLAFLGAGGMGKTTVVIALLHHLRIVNRFGSSRLFISCEAFADANAIVVSLAKLLGLPVLGDLQAAIIAHLSSGPRLLLVLDNLETVWLSGGAPVATVEELLGQLSQVSLLSLVITSRGTELPQSMRCSNADTAVLESFSLEAALETFQDGTGCLLSRDDEPDAKLLLNAVDRMLLAVSLLGRLARRGNSVSQLLVRWNSEHTSLLRTHGKGRENNVEMSIKVSIEKLCEADDSQEALHLLSLCSMLPEGLHPEVFDALRPCFASIDRARESLSSYALASLGVDRVLRTLSPVRHFVLQHHPPPPQHRNSLYSIYFTMVQSLPVEMNEHFKDLAAAAAPEMNNISSLLLTLVDQPSQQITDAVVQLTQFTYWHQPTTTLASTLLPHLEHHAEWKATCLQVIGTTQIKLDEYTSAIESLTAAAQLFLEVGNLSAAARSKRAAAEPHIFLNEYDQAQVLLNEAISVCVELADDFEVARCRMKLGEVLRIKGDHPAAIEHLSVARQIFDRLGSMFRVSQCSESLGLLYLAQGVIASAAVELEAARLSFTSLGNTNHVAQSTRFLGIVRHYQGQLVQAEQLLKKSESIYKDSGNRLGLAECAQQFGHLRCSQERPKEALIQFKLAHSLYEVLKMHQKARHCNELIEQLAVKIDRPVTKSYILTFVQACFFLAILCLILPFLLVLAFLISIPTGYDE